MPKPLEIDVTPLNIDNKIRCTSSNYMYKYDSYSLLEMTKLYLKSQKVTSKDQFLYLEDPLKLKINLLLKVIIYLISH